MSLAGTSLPIKQEVDVMATFELLHEEWGHGIEYFLLTLIFHNMCWISEKISLLLGRFLDKLYRFFCDLAHDSFGSLF